MPKCWECKHGQRTVIRNSVIYNSKRKLEKFRNFSTDMTKSSAHDKTGEENLFRATLYVRLTLPHYNLRNAKYSSSPLFSQLFCLCNFFPFKISLKENFSPSISVSKFNLPYLLNHNAVQIFQLSKTSFKFVANCMEESKWEKGIRVNHPVTNVVLIVLWNFNKIDNSRLVWAVASVIIIIITIIIITTTTRYM